MRGPPLTIRDTISIEGFGDIHDGLLLAREVIEIVSGYENVLTPLSLEYLAPRERKKKNR